MIRDGQPPLPETGTVLRNIGLRLRGDVTSAPDDRVEGIVETQSSHLPDSLYQVTGRVGEPRDFDVDTGAGPTHAGVEYVLHVGGQRFQVQADGRAGDVRPDSRVTVQGRFEVIGAYEWEHFGLDDTRSTWLARGVTEADDGNLLIDLVAPPSA
jgi:hypothetical protein